MAALITNSTLLSNSGGVIFGSEGNVPTSTVTTEVEGPVVTATVTKPPTTVTVTSVPAADAPRRAGDVVLPHDFFSGYSVDLDTLQPDWRYADDQYGEGLDLTADCCTNGLTVPAGALIIDPAGAELNSPDLRDRCRSTTGQTDHIAAPREEEIYCVKTDEGRTAVMRILDAGLDSGNAGVSLVVWD
ncbi:hypothetical protein ACFFKU_02900 [Kineococcus gynurae]|uniref:Uncharacterized protein n=1 Tax=Kineococcus gynurae TaxID=452979 RepID=A0ABV5LS79_9ACTN